MFEWIRNPRLARHLARATWPLLVVGYFTVERADLRGLDLDLAISALLAAAFVLNLPVVYGLSVSRADHHTKAYRVVAIGLVLRSIATIAVVSVLRT